MSSAESRVNLQFTLCAIVALLSVWLATPIGIPPSPPYVLSMLVWILSWTSHLNPSNFALGLMVLWAIWGARNNSLWNDCMDSPDIIAARGLSWWQEFQRVAFPPSAWDSLLVPKSLVGGPALLPISLKPMSMQPGIKILYREVLGWYFEMTRAALLRLLPEKWILSLHRFTWRRWLLVLAFFWRGKGVSKILSYREWFISNCDASTWFFQLFVWH